MINRERLLNTFLDYVQIDSESGHEAAMAARLKADLEQLGLEQRVLTSVASSVYPTVHSSP